MNGNVITDAILLRTIIIVLYEEKQEMTPCEIFKSAHRSDLVPYQRGSTERIFEIIVDSYKQR